MKHYRIQESNLIEIQKADLTKAQEIEQNTLAPDRTIWQEVDMGGASFQAQGLEEVQNPNYAQELKTYNESRIYKVADLEELKDKINAKLTDTATKRSSAREEMIKNLNNAKTPQEFLDKFIAQYEKLLQSSFAQPSIFGGGSRLAKAMREFAKEFLFIELSPKLKNKQVDYKITIEKLHNIVTSQPTAKLEKK